MENLRRSDTRSSRAIRWRLIPNDKAVAMMLFIAAAMLILASCQRKPVMSHSSFVNLPASGWQNSMSLEFRPVYDDSIRTHQLILAVRHDNSYKYANLSLVVDIIGNDSVVKRQTVEMRLADEYGNWTGAGFGALYQDKTCIATAIAPDEARSVVVWQAMEGNDTLRGVVNLGIIAQPQ